MGVVLETRYSPLQALYAADVTTAGTSFTDPADTTSDPATSNAGGMKAGAIGWGRTGAITPPTAKIVPFGTTTSAQTLLMAVYAVEKIIGVALKDSWTYHLLAAFTCTLCTKTGVAGSAVDASHLYCDTITLIGTSGNANVSCEIVSPTGNQEAHVVVETKGPDLLFVDFRINASAVSCNALVGRL